MVLVTVLGLGLAAVLGYFAISAVAVIAHWLSIFAAGALGVAAFRFILTSDQLDFLGFDSEVFETLTAAIVSGSLAFISFRLMEAVLAVFGYGFAFLAVGVGVLMLVFGGPAVLGAIGAFVGEVLAALGGEQ